MFSTPSHFLQAATYHIAVQFIFKKRFIMKYVYLCLFLLLEFRPATCKYSGPISPLGLDLIKRFEGFYSEFTEDRNGIRTIGYGHDCHVWSCRVPLNRKYYVPLNESSAESLLKEDLTSGRYDSCVTNAVTYRHLNHNQYSALVAFVFNMGCGAFRDSTLLKKLNREDVQGASDELARWNKVGLKVSPELTRRRAQEQALFCRGAPAQCQTCLGIVHGLSSRQIGIYLREDSGTSSRPLGILRQGQIVHIIGRKNGTVIERNPFWFEMPEGYATAAHIGISQNNGEVYCNPGVF